jgi:hypothetical protein
VLPAPAGVWGHVPAGGCSGCVCVPACACLRVRACACARVFGPPCSVHAACARACVGCVGRPPRCTGATSRARRWRTPPTSSSATITAAWWRTMWRAASWTSTACLCRGTCAGRRVHARLRTSVCACVLPYARECVCWSLVECLLSICTRVVSVCSCAQLRGASTPQHCACWLWVYVAPVPRQVHLQRHPLGGAQ